MTAYTGVIGWNRKRGTFPRGDREVRAINSVLRVIISVDEPREMETVPRQFRSGRKSQGENDARTAANPRRSFFFPLFTPRVPPENSSLPRTPPLFSSRYRLLTSETVSPKPRWDVPSVNWIFDCSAIQRATVGRSKKRTQFTIELLCKPRASWFWRVTQTDVLKDHPRYMVILLH